MRAAHRQQIRHESDTAAWPPRRLSGRQSEKEMDSFLIVKAP
jgi:hypothetical protein